jgi:hypothetical protein
VSAQWQPYRESLQATFVRTGTIAVVLGLVIAEALGGGIRRWPMATLLALWPALGGHGIEIFFLNWLRPRLPSGRFVQVTARLIVWFAGGCALAVAMRLTAAALQGFSPPRAPIWWVGGIGFIGIELVAHLVLQLRGHNSFYNGRG